MPPPPTPPTPEEDVPERLGRYRLVRLVSTGGMARVYEGRRESLAGVSPRVAIKVILPDFDTDAAIRSLFVNEARVGAQLQHQNLVQIQDFDQEENRFYLVMEFIDGITLRQVIRTCRRNGLPVPLAVVAEIGRQACEGLDYAHHATAEDGRPLHLVHRDVKPSNLMLNAQGIVKILDFGVIKALSSRERAGSVKGTWGYMAPEQAGGFEVGPLADVFGLAVVLYELLALQPLFPEKEPVELKRLLAEDEGARRAAALTGTQGTLAPVLIRALQRDPEARFDTAAEMGKALSAFIPDPVLARQEVIRFREAVMALEGEAAGGPATPSPVSHPPAVAPAVSAKPSTAPTQGLRVAVGAAPGDVQILPPKRARGVAMALVALVALAILGFAGWQAFHPLPPTPAPTPRVETVVPEAPPPEVAPNPPQALAEPVGTGLLTVSSTPRAQVWVDGRLLRWAPLFQYSLPAGEHTVELITDDGRRQAFQVTIEEGRETSRVWSFDERRELAP